MNISKVVALPGGTHFSPLPSYKNVLNSSFKKKIERVECGNLAGNSISTERAMCSGKTHHSFLSGNASKKVVLQATFCRNEMGRKGRSLMLRVCFFFLLEARP